MSVSVKRPPPALFVGVVSAVSLAVVAYTYITGILSLQTTAMLLGVVAALATLTLFSAALFILHTREKLGHALTITSEYETVRNEMEVLSAAREVSLLAVMEVSREEAAAEILNILAEPLEARRIALLVTSEKDTRLTPLALRTRRRLYQKRIPLKKEELDAAEEAFRRMRPIKTRTRRGLLLAYPFGGEEGARGTLLLLTRHKTAERTEHRIFHIIRSVSLALRMPTLYERAVYDALTGLLSRRHLNRQLPLIFAEMRRTGAPLSVIMLDIDHFKRINDTYGHLFGDEVLRRVASSVKQSIRSYDSAYRYGGEEMCIILPRTSSETALTIARRCHANISRLKLRTEDGNSVSVTVSVGVATLTPSDESPQSLLERADAALYHAKETGRNRIITASETPHLLKQND